jgi:hypothetical protein
MSIWRRSRHTSEQTARRTKTGWGCQEPTDTCTRGLSIYVKNSWKLLAPRIARPPCWRARRNLKRSMQPDDDDDDDSIVTHVGEQAPLGKSTSGHNTLIKRGGHRGESKCVGAEFSSFAWGCDVGVQRARVGSRMQGVISQRRKRKVSTERRKRPTVATNNILRSSPKRPEG